MKTTTIAILICLATFAATAPTCKDSYTPCSSWGKNGECISNPTYMKSTCKSCGRCHGTVSSCMDGNTMCSTWAKNGECKANPNYMLSTCRKSCGVCGGKKTPTITKATVKTCMDGNTMCSTWAKNGECKANPNYMMTTCRKSCGVCGDKKTPTIPKATCKNGQTPCGTAGCGLCLNKKTPTIPKGCMDGNTMCSTWAKNGECKANPNYMMTTCRKSCGVCGDKKTPTISKATCKNGQTPCGTAGCGLCLNKKTSTMSKGCMDGNTMCSTWAKNGECKANPNYMMTTCRKSCGVCGDKKTPTIPKGTNCKYQNCQGQCQNPWLYGHTMCG